MTQKSVETSEAGPVGAGARCHGRCKAARDRGPGGNPARGPDLRRRYAQIGGLTAATFITLLLVPVLYAVFVLDLKLVKWES